MTTHQSSASRPTSSKSQRTLLLVSQFYTFGVTVQLLEHIFWCVQKAQLFNAPNRRALSYLNCLTLSVFTNSFTFLGACFFMFYFIGFVASTVLFVVTLHHVLKCSVRMQGVDYSRQNHWLLQSFSCMHSKVSFIPDNRLVSVATGK